MAYNQHSSQRENDRVRYELIERIGVLGIKENGWTKEVNIVSWNGGVGKVDIRDWDPSHARMTKGITMLEEEAEKLAKALAKRYGLVPAQDSQRKSHSGYRAECSRSTNGSSGLYDEEEAGGFSHEDRAAESSLDAFEEQEGTSLIENDVPGEENGEDPVFS